MPPFPLSLLPFLSFPFLPILFLFSHGGLSAATKRNHSGGGRNAESRHAYSGVPCSSPSFARSSNILPIHTYFFLFSRGPSAASTKRKHSGGGNAESGTQHGTTAYRRVSGHSDIETDEDEFIVGAGERSRGAHTTQQQFGAQRKNAFDSMRMAAKKRRKSDPSSGGGGSAANTQADKGNVCARLVGVNVVMCTGAGESQLHFPGLG